MTTEISGTEARSYTNSGVGLEAPDAGEVGAGDLLFVEAETPRDLEREVPEVDGGVEPVDSLAFDVLQHGAADLGLARDRRQVESERFSRLPQEIARRLFGEAELEGVLPWRGLVHRERRYRS